MIDPYLQDLLVMERESACMVPTVTMSHGQGHAQLSAMQLVKGLKKEEPTFMATITSLEEDNDPSLFYNTTWISFQHVNDLEIEEGGNLDGQGPSAWNNPQCATLPSTLKSDFSQNATVHNIQSINNKKYHFNLFNCNNVTFNHLNITAPGDSFNTDDIHIGVSTNI
ncbi:exopolygalacturonase-like [Lycium barbarum]|uniref:exopolygalacturonase-like n=1 Tax=Lycium barbarum TaxID=112863 RepID=UPI00293EA2AE|nr:exopolygalacturonase-like [Lycium barbarum]